jgi:hypothetical protein
VIQEHDAEVQRTTARKLLFQLLAHRKLTLDAAQRARIEACHDLEMLERWLLRATDVRDAAELLT